MTQTTNTTPRFIDLYYEWMERGHMPSLGLCGSLPEELIECFKLFSPTKDDYLQLKSQRLVSLIYSNKLEIQQGYWASDYEVGGNMTVRQLGFGETRQNIILFCAAINGEL